MTEEVGPPEPGCSPSQKPGQGRALREACLTNSYILNVSNQIIPPHHYLTIEQGFKTSLWLTARDQWAMLSLILWEQEAAEKGGRERGWIWKLG